MISMLIATETATVIKATTITKREAAATTEAVNTTTTTRQQSFLTSSIQNWVRNQTDSSFNLSKLAVTRVLVYLSLLPSNISMLKLVAF